MKVLKQKTLRKDLVISGIGVHSGVTSHIHLEPAPADAGIVMQSGDDPSSKIYIGQVVPDEAPYATVLRNGTWYARTVEHLMAALNMLGVDNVLIKVYGNEIPILDGSSKPFVEQIMNVGLKELGVDARWLAPRQQLVFEDVEGRRIEIDPLDNGTPYLHVAYESEFKHPLLGATQFEATLNEEFFITQVAPARTFGFLDQWPQLKKMGLALGSDLENTLVIDRDHFVNERRFEDECVRHKFLDLLGDLALLGKRLAAKVKARKTGHAFNRRVIEHYITSPEQWMLV